MLFSVEYPLGLCLRRVSNITPQRRSMRCSDGTELADCRRRELRSAAKSSPIRYSLRYRSAGKHLAVPPDLHCWTAPRDKISSRLCTRIKLCRQRTVSGVCRLVCSWMVSDGAFFVGRAAPRANLFPVSSIHRETKAVHRGTGSNSDSPQHSSFFQIFT